MNPNSQHQSWSKWTFEVTPGVPRARSLDNVTANCAKFGRRVFGSASAMRVRRIDARWVIEVRTEGHPVHDTDYVARVQAEWTAFLVTGFGVGTTVTLTTRHEAGARPGGPPDQLIILPPLPVLSGVQ